MINKNAENRDKWFARFMCVFIACCLWIYVMSEQNPIVEKEFAIPLASRNLAEGMILWVHIRSWSMPALPGGM